MRFYTTCKECATAWILKRTFSLNEASPRLKFTLYFLKSATAASYRFWAEKYKKTVDVSAGRKGILKGTRSGIAPHTGHPLSEDTKHLTRTGSNGLGLLLKLCGKLPVCKIPFHHVMPRD